MNRFAGWRIGLVGVVTVLAVGAGGASAFEPLPSAGQVNDDPTAGIDPALGVNGADPANADVVGGALTAGKVAVPWAIFRQATTGHDQIFVRSFAGGAWTTRGSGTVGGSSSAGPTVQDSLNFDRSEDGEAPSIDFAGAGRTVPWATWYESTTGTGFGADNVFASRFDNSGDANQGKWLLEGQGRGIGGFSSTPVPSLNIHTNRQAQDPSVAGGATVAGGAPVPWITWQEQDGGVDQIFTSRAVQPLTPPTCPPDGANPAKPASAMGAVGAFCWQEVGVERIASGPSTTPPSTTDPSLNVDRTRDGVEPEIAFAGRNDTVPWVVWYEQHGSGAGLLGNKMVFAAKAVAGGTVSGTVDGSFHWQVVGEGTAGQTDVLDDTPATGGSCAANQAAEQACSLNKVPTADAENPRVAAGTLTPGSPTVPWVTWDEDIGGHQQVFVARLVGGDHFELANDGAPISTGANDSIEPDITFSQNTPYVSWREDTGGATDTGFLGHFAVNASGEPMFQQDESDVSLTPAVQAEVREPISSGCAANPFDADGSSCPGGAIGTPFFLYTNGTSPRSLFAGAYEPGAPVTGAARSVSAGAATVGGSVKPDGSVVSAFFQFGPTAAYGRQTAARSIGPADVATGFTSALTGLAANTTIHYRAVVTTDLGTFTGADRTLRTAGISGPALKLKLIKSTIRKLLKSAKLKLDVRFAAAGKVTVSATATISVHHKHKALTLGLARVRFTRADAKTVAIAVSKRARSKLAHVRGRVVIKVSGQGTDRAGRKSKRVTSRATFARR
jgi:hypothetical protein